MPEVNFTVRLPDGKTKECYSPSSVVLKHFAIGEKMSVSEFVQRSRLALNEASERVRAKFGFSCSSAISQIYEIEEFSQNYPSDGIVQIVQI